MFSVQLSIMNHGDDLQLICTAEGVKPIYYKWYKDNKPLESRRVDHRMNASHPILQLNSLVLSDNGNYTCRVRNKFGSIENSFIVVVNGKDEQVQICHINLFK